MSFPGPESPHRVGTEVTMAAQHARPRPRAVRGSMSSTMRKPLTATPVEAGLKAVLAPLARRLQGDLVCEITPGVGTTTYGDPASLAACVAGLVQGAIDGGVRDEVHVRVARQFAGWSPTSTVMVTVLAGEGSDTRELAHEELALPCADEDESSAALAQTRVLVVGRSARMRRVTTRTAERFGAEASEAVDYESAVARLRDHAARGSAFDAVVVDAVAVDAGLTRLFERLRADGSLGSPVTLVATVGEERERVSYLEAGATATLEKPVLPRELRDAISAARASAGSAVLARAAARVVADSGPVGRSGAPRGRASSRKLRFLVVEDEALNARFAHLAIRRLGHEAVHVGSAAEAEARLAHESYDAVMVDLAMPELGGYALARWIRHREAAGVRVPIFALGEDAPRAAAAGIDTVLAKPVAVDALDAALARFVEPHGGRSTSER